VEIRLKRSGRRGSREIKLKREKAKPKKKKKKKDQQLHPRGI
jgi:hypothetical protein